LAFRASYIAIEAYQGFRRNLLLALSMVIIVAISLTLLGLALLAGRQVSLYGGYWYNKVEVSIFLSDDVTADQRNSIESQLHALPIVQSVSFEDKDQAYQHFKEQFHDSPDLVHNVTASVLPESFRVKLKDPNQFAQVHDAFCSGKFDAKGNEICNPGIERVIDQKKLVERLFAVLNLFRAGFYGLAGLLGVAALVLIAVTVRVAAFARRKETQIMKLVGASNTYIRLPFLAEGIFSGLLGAVLSFVILGLMMYGLGKVRLQIAFFQALPIVGQGEYRWACMILLLCGVGASALASLLALRKYVRV
jgi:cell division transport system permease protein